MTHMTRVCHKAKPVATFTVSGVGLVYRIRCPRCGDYVYWSKRAMWRAECHCTLLWEPAADDVAFIGTGNESRQLYAAAMEQWLEQFRRDHNLKAGKR